MAAQQSKCECCAEVLANVLSVTPICSVTSSRRNIARIYQGFLITRGNAMGVYVKGAIKEMKYLAQAYKLGLKVK